MKPSTYTTVGTEGTAKLVVKKSTFLSFAFPAMTVDEVEERVKECRKKYYDARHVCYAYVLEADSSLFRGSDNGEPSGTAGRPILGTIRAAGLTFTGVIVVRYFGGIKLGTSGLAAAYKEVAEMALAAASLVDVTVEDSLQFTFDYSRINDVMKLLKTTGVHIVENLIDLECSVSIRVPSDRTEALRAQLAKIPTLHIADNN